MPAVTLTRQFELTRDLVSSFVVLIDGLSEADKLRLSLFFPYRPKEETTAFPNILFWSIALNALHRTFPIPREVLDDGLRERFTILPRSREGSVPEIVLELWTTLSEADSSTLTARWDELGSVMPQATLRFTLQEKCGEQRSFRTGHAIVKAKVSRNELEARLDVVETTLPDDDDDEPEMIVTPLHPQPIPEPHIETTPVPRIETMTPLSVTYRAAVLPSSPSAPQPPQHVLSPELLNRYDPTRAFVKAGQVGIPHHQPNQPSGSWRLQDHEQRPFPPVQIPPHYLPGPANGMATASASASEAGPVVERRMLMSHRKTSSASALSTTRRLPTSSGARSSVPLTQRPRSSAAQSAQTPRTGEAFEAYIRERARQTPGLVELPDSDKCFQCLMTSRPCFAPAPLDLTQPSRVLPSGLRIQPNHSCMTCHLTEPEGTPGAKPFKCSFKTRVGGELAGAQIRRAAERTLAIKQALQRAQRVDPKELDHVLLDMITAGRYLGEYF